jgi:hypothetical protein
MEESFVGVVDDVCEGAEAGRKPSVSMEGRNSRDRKEEQDVRALLQPLNPRLPQLLLLLDLMQSVHRVAIEEPLGFAFGEEGGTAGGGHAGEVLRQCSSVSFRRKRSRDEGGEYRKDGESKGEREGGRRRRTRTNFLIPI